MYTSVYVYVLYFHHAVMVSLLRFMQSSSRYFHVITTLLPRYYRVIITLLSRYYHVIITSSLTVLSRYYHVTIDSIMLYYRLIAVLTYGIRFTSLHECKYISKYVCRFYEYAYIHMYIYW